MRFIKRFLFTIIFILLAGCAVLTYGGYQKFNQALLNCPLEDVVAEVENGEDFVKYEDINGFYFDAVVAVEDRRFFTHSGFDITGTMRAIITDIRSKELKEGGSTITQQLAKNLYFPADNTPERKIAEIFMAAELEKNYSKEKILELYANVIYFGSGYYCISDAAMGYFEKSPSQLTEYEASLLAGVPNAPSVYSPDVNPHLAAQRQRQVLEAMASCGYIEKGRINEILTGY